MPLILVGGNGAGKTNFLATVSDALFEAAAVHYDDVLPRMGSGRAWFRVLGGTSLTSGATSGFSLLRFNDNSTNRFFKERVGEFDLADAHRQYPNSIPSSLNWTAHGPDKEFTIDSERSRVIFESGVYVYFPSSRSEVPYWLNRRAIEETQFDISPNFAKHIKKPLYIERALDKFKQWLIAALVDTHLNMQRQPMPGLISWMPYSHARRDIVNVCNDLLRAVLLDQDVNFVWTGRKSPEKLAIAKRGALLLPSVDALSAGQSILLGMFGTIIRYADMSRADEFIELTEIEGICIIDEVDAHVHVELQHRILPKLFRMFPRIQFLLSSHSPVFVLGMEREFGAESIQVIEMPDGLPVGAETYAEFGHALEAVALTSAFTRKMIVQAGVRGRPIVYVEGETDAPYLKRAATLLGRSDLLARCDIEWIGARGDDGQGFHTGKDALKHTLALLRAKPQIARRKILLLSDNDQNVEPKDYDGFSVRKLPVNLGNTKIQAGIENLLSEDCIKEEFYRTKTKLKPNGDTIVSHSLRKSELCASLCEIGNATQFAAFKEALRVIEDYLALVEAN